MSKSVGALRPKLKKLLFCSCDENKQLQRMYMGISLQHSSKCTVMQELCAGVLGQNEFAHLSGVLVLRRDTKITCYDKIHRVMG